MYTTSEIFEMVWGLSPQACMSFVRAYKEHLCSAIFQFSKLDIVL